MNLPNKPKILAATYNPVSNTKMISFLADFPTVLLAELRTHRILTQGSLYEHSELVDFNLSANSARAIPHNKYLEKVLENPFVPIWTKQQKGMSGKLIEDKVEIEDLWLSNLQDADSFVCYQDFDGNLKSFYSSWNTNIKSQCEEVHDIKTLRTNYQDLIKLGVHKQNANRLLAPFAYTTCIISGTEWDNFFELRCPKYKMASNGKIYKSKKEAIKNEPSGEVVATNENWSYLNEWEEKDWLNGDMCSNISTAQPEFQVIAEMLYDLYQEADWKESKYHIPYEEDIDNLYKEKIINYISTIGGTIKDYINEEFNIKMLISASMCAKLSYNTQDNPDTFEKHLDRLYNPERGLIPNKHQEPFSHQAVTMNRDEYACSGKKQIISKEKFEKIKNKYNPNDYTVQGFSDDKVVFEEYGWCYNLRGFISQRYIIENL